MRFTFEELLEGSRSVRTLNCKERLLDINNSLSSIFFVKPTVRMHFILQLNAPIYTQMYITKTKVSQNDSLTKCDVSS